MKSTGDKVAERYFTDLRVDYAFTKKLYFYGLGGWSQDKFSGIDSRYYIGPGVGYHFLTGGASFSFHGSRSLLCFRAILPTIRMIIIWKARVFGEYAFVLTEKTKIFQSVEYLHNFNDAQKYHVLAVTGLTTTLTDIISVKMTYEIHYANEPVPDTLDETDTIFTVALVVNF